MHFMGCSKPYDCKYNSLESYNCNKSTCSMQPYTSGYGQGNNSLCLINARQIVPHNPPFSFKGGYRA